MIVYKEIQQRSEEWFLMRHGRIGGTASKGLFIDSDTLFISLLSEHLEDFELTENFMSYEMERGIEMEPIARAFLSSYVGVDFQEVGWLQSEESSLIGCSPDGISECEKVACEVKCLGAKAHTEVLLNNEAPKVYIPQIINYFTVNPKLESLWFICYREESVKHFIHEYKRDSLVDVGWKKRVEIPQTGKLGKPIKPKTVTEPDLRTIGEWSAIALEEALRLEVKIKDTVERLKF